MLLTPKEKVSIRKELERFFFESVKLFVHIELPMAGEHPRPMKIDNPPSPPFSKGGMGGFENYFRSDAAKKPLGNSPYSKPLVGFCTYLEQSQEISLWESDLPLS